MSSIRYWKWNSRSRKSSLYFQIFMLHWKWSGFFVLAHETKHGPLTVTGVMHTFCRKLRWPPSGCRSFRTLSCDFTSRLLRRTLFLDFWTSKNGSTVFVLEHHDGSFFWTIGHLQRLEVEPGLWNIVEVPFLDTSGHHQRLKMEFCFWNIMFSFSGHLGIIKG